MYVYTASGLEFIGRVGVYGFGLGFIGRVGVCGFGFGVYGFGFKVLVVRV